MANTKKTDIVPGCARKSIVPVSREGALMVRGKNPIAAAADKFEARADAEKAMKGAKAAKEKRLASIFGAAAGGKWSIVLSVVDADNVNDRDRLGKSLLMVAAEQGEIEVMKQLVKIGAFKQSIDDCGRDAVFYAMKSANESAAAWLVEKGAGWKRALETVVKEGKYLLAGRFEAFGATAEEIDALREKYPNPTIVLSDRVRRVDDDGLAVMALERMFTDHRSPKPTGQESGASTDKDAEPGRRKHEPITDFIC